MGGLASLDAPFGLSLEDCKALVEADTAATGVAAEAGEITDAAVLAAAVLVLLIGAELVAAAAAAAAGTAGTAEGTATRAGC